MNKLILTLGIAFVSLSFSARRVVMQLLKNVYLTKIFNSPADADARPL